MSSSAPEHVTNTPHQFAQQRTPRRPRRHARAPITIFAIACVAGTIGGCPGTTTDSSSGSIGPLGGSVTITDATTGRAGGYIQIPAGALTETIEFTLTAYRTAINLFGTPALVPVSITPNGTEFTAAVEIGLPYRDTDDPDQLAIYRYDSANATWYPLADQTVDTTNGVITGTTRLLSIFALGDKLPAEMDAELFYDTDTSCIVGAVQVTTPLDEVPISTAAADTYSTTNMAGILSDSPFDVRPAFVVTLKQRQTGSTADRDLQTVRIQYRVAAVIGTDDTPSQVAASIDNGPYDQSFLVDGSRAVALANVETLFSGAPLLFQFDEVTPTGTAEYYLEVLLYYEDIQGNFFNSEWQNTDAPTTKLAYYFNSKASMAKLATMSAPPDTDGNGVVDDYEDAADDGTTGREVLPPSFITTSDGTFTGTLEVVIACGTAGARVLYTTDGSTPTRTNGTDAACGVEVTLTATTTLKAMSYKDGMTDSEVSQATYTKTD